MGWKAELTSEYCKYNLALCFRLAAGEIFSWGVASYVMLMYGCSSAKKLTVVNMSLNLGRGPVQLLSEHYAIYSDKRVVRWWCACVCTSQGSTASGIIIIDSTGHP
jgi:hypothetical protein